MISSYQQAILEEPQEQEHEKAGADYGARFTLFLDRAVQPQTNFHYCQDSVSPVSAKSTTFKQRERDICIGY